MLFKKISHPEILEISQETFEYLLHFCTGKLIQLSIWRYKTWAQNSPCRILWKNIKRIGGTVLPRAMPTHTVLIMDMRYIWPTSPVFHVSPSYDSPLSWPSARGHCAPWRLLLWRWEFAGSHSCSAAWEGERVGVMHFVVCASLSVLEHIVTEKKSGFHKHAKLKICLQRLLVWLEQTFVVSTGNTPVGEWFGWLVAALCYFRLVLFAHQYIKHVIKWHAKWLLAV